MPRLLYSPASPYSAKVRMAARHLGVPVDPQTVNTSQAPDTLIAGNPLGKIPTLLLDDGSGVFDSRVIMHHLDPSGDMLFKEESAALAEAAADGICDSALAHVYERRNRPEEKIHQPVLDWQWSKVERGLDWMARHLPPIGWPDAGSFALRATLGYLSLRFAGQWETGREGLTEWAAAFDRAHPDLLDCLPA
ncbi:MAG: glutathione S-transferase [Methylobacterium mesophilicum]|nr:glutathione S-transferase [Methylobacterium mesophilicum]